MIPSDKILEYLSKKLKDFQKSTKKGQYLFTCPNVSNHRVVWKEPTATFIPGSDKINCLNCDWKGNFYDVVRLLEEDKKSKSDAEITEYILGTLKMNPYPELDEYKKYNWALCQVAKNGNAAIESDWTNKEYREKSDWIKWLEEGKNIGLRTGEVNNITVIDADLKVAPTGKFDVVYRLLTASKTLWQDTPHGKHFVFQYDKDIRQTQNMKRAGITIDIRNDGGQIVIAPSKRDTRHYKWENLGAEIKKMPDELKIKLLELLNLEKEGSITKVATELSPEMKKLINNPIELVANNLTGCCNETFVQFGGVLLKMGIHTKEVQGILHYLNKNWLKEPMPINAIDAMLGSLEGYKHTEEQTLEKIIYEYLKAMKHITATDVVQSCFNGEKEKRKIVDKYLSEFVKAGKATRPSRGLYVYKEKVEWTDSPEYASQEVEYEIPYFNEIAHFHSGDIIIIGAKTGEGKTHIAMNFVKQFKDLSKGIIKPHYLPLEAGSRYQKIAKILGLVPGDYYVPTEQIENPIRIELESKAVTIIDWLYLGEDFAQTETIMKYLNDEMTRKGGILILFTQLKDNREWFAVNLIKNFARFACKYLFDGFDGKTGYFQVDKMTDPRGNYREHTIPCEFNFDTKLLIKK